VNGFYPVLNEVHDKAIQELSLAECALFEHIWRKLIGWKQFEDTISISQLVKETSGSRATILRLLKKLETKRWIVVIRHDGVTNSIGIPECPGIKMRLGWYQNDTGTSVKMKPPPVSKRYTQQIDPKDSLQTSNNNKGVASLPKNKPQRVPLRERITRQANRDEVLPNGMTRGELLDLVEFKPAVINHGKSEHMEILVYLGNQPRERIEWAVEQTKAENGGRGIAANGALKWIYNGIDQYEYKTGNNEDNAAKQAYIEEMKADLAEAREFPEENAVYIEQREYLLRQKGVKFDD